MPVKLIAYLAAVDKACCIWSWFERYRLWKSIELAAHIGVSRETIKYWRKEIRKGRCSCANVTGCCRDQEIPPVTPKRLLSLSDRRS
jgi:hypothetical protein